MTAGFTVEPLDCTPAAEEVADMLQALISVLLGRGYLLSDLIVGADMNLAAMKTAAIALVTHGEPH